jgi:hypothetical protein
MGLMFKRKTKNWDKPFPEKVARRVAMLPTADLALWMEQAMSETNRSLGAYLKNGDTVSVDEILIGAEAINALASELKRRIML